MVFCTQCTIMKYQTKQFIFGNSNLLHPSLEGSMHQKQADVSRLNLSAVKDTQANLRKSYMNFHRRISLVLLAVMFLVMSLIPGEIVAFAATVSPGAVKAFSDVSVTSWYAPDLRFITTDPRKILEGYSDGKYYPERTLTVEQFIKCAVAAAGFRPTANGGHWAQPYVDKAIQLGMIRQGQFNTFSRGMTRGEMATVIMSGLISITGESPLFYNSVEMQKRMSDYAQIGAGSLDSICKAYAMGILTGYPDGKFHPERVLTRAQATSVIRRMIDATARMKLAPLGDGSGADMWSDAEFEQFMATEEHKKYLNPGLINRMVNGRIEYLFFESMDPVTAKITKKPGYLNEPLESMFYQLAKHMAYYAKKYNATATVGYDADSGGVAEFNFASKEHWFGYGSSVSFSMHFTTEPIVRKNVVQMIPAAKDVKLRYEWYIRRLYRDEDIIGKEIGASPAGYDWSTEKYVQILKTACVDIYGVNQGALFCNFMTDMYDKSSQTFDPIVLEYAGYMPEFGTDVMFHYPDGFGKMYFYTGDIVVQK